MSNLKNDKTIERGVIVEPDKNDDVNVKPEKFSKAERAVIIATSTLAAYVAVFILGCVANISTGLPLTEVAIISGGILLLVLVLMRVRGWMTRFKNGMDDNQVRRKIAGIILLKKHISNKFSRIHISGTANFKRDSNFLRQARIISEICNRTFEAISIDKKVVLIDSHLLIKDSVSNAIKDNIVKLSDRKVFTKEVTAKIDVPSKYLIPFVYFYTHWNIVDVYKRKKSIYFSLNPSSLDSINIKCKK